MNHTELASTGLGGVDTERFIKAIELVIKASELSRIPDMAEIYTDAFLPEGDERIYKLL